MQRYDVGQGELFLAPWLKKKSVFTFSASSLLLLRGQEASAKSFSFRRAVKLQNVAVRVWKVVCLPDIQGTEWMSGFSSFPRQASRAAALTKAGETRDDAVPLNSFKASRWESNSFFFTS